MDLDRRRMRAYVSVCHISLRRRVRALGSTGGTEVFLSHGNDRLSRFCVVRRKGGGRTGSGFPPRPSFLLLLFLPLSESPSCFSLLSVPCLKEHT